MLEVLWAAMAQHQVSVRGSFAIGWEVPVVVVPPPVLHPASSVKQEPDTGGIIQQYRHRRHGGGRVSRRTGEPATGETASEATEATENQERRSIYRPRHHWHQPRVSCQWRPRRLNRGGIICQ